MTFIWGSKSMRVKCLHGFFFFQETAAGQAGDWSSITGLALAPWRDGFTFEKLAEAPLYTIAGGVLLDTPAIKTFEGEPWEVFEANAVVYDFARGLVVPIAAVTQATTISQAGEYFVSPGLLLPGSVVEGRKVRDFTGWVSRAKGATRWLYSEVTYV